MSNPLDIRNEIIDTLLREKVFDVRDGSVELFIDDEGLLQKIIFKKKRRKREGENLQVHPLRSGKVTSFYDKLGIMQQITLETEWRRNK